MRFLTIFLMFEHLFKLKVIIKQIITDSEWTTLTNTLHGTHRHIFHQTSYIFLSQNKEELVLGILLPILCTWWN
jgi:hypothetical protein